MEDGLLGKEINDFFDNANAENLNQYCHLREEEVQLERTRLADIAKNSKAKLLRTIDQK